MHHWLGLRDSGEGGPKVWWIWNIITRLSPSYLFLWANCTLDWLRAIFNSVARALGRGRSGCSERYLRHLPLHAWRCNQLACTLLVHQGTLLTQVDCTRTIYLYHKKTGCWASQWSGQFATEWEVCCNLGACSECLNKSSKQKIARAQHSI